MGPCLCNKMQCYLVNYYCNWHGYVDGGNHLCVSDDAQKMKMVNKSVLVNSFAFCI